jgi:HAE1 family hydrophobic/amphiphilic exporter-1
MRLPDVCIRRPVFAVMLIGGLVVLGLVSIPRLGIDLFPRVEFPVVTVTTVLDGASPETIEREVSQVLEESINTIEGISSLRSASSDSLSLIFVEFELEYDVQDRAQEVRDKVAAVRGELPRDIEPPVVGRVDPDAQPILAVMLAGPHSIREITEVADKRVKPRLERIPGVGSISIVGGRAREIRIWIDPLRLAGHSLAVDDVIAALEREHAELPGGRLETEAREIAIRTRGRLTTADQFGGVVVAEQAGRVVHLRDVALVEDGMADERTLSRLDGRRGVALLVRRQSGENTVAVADAVKAELEHIRPDLPPAYQMVVALDDSRFILSAIRDVAVDLAWGALFASLVVFVFLRNLRSTLLAAVAIPSSIVASFAFFYFLGFTLNTMTLMALSLSIGLLIDDAIVVLENVYRHMERGKDPKEAASFGTNEIGLAVVATTAANCAVFIPIAFLTGVVGRFFREFGLVVAGAVCISTLVALTLTPMLASRYLRVRAGPERRPVYRWLEGGFARLEAAYRISLDWGLLAFVGGLGISRLVPIEFVSPEDRSEFNVWLKLPLGSTVDQSEAVAGAVERELHGMPGVGVVFSTVGAGVQKRVNEVSLYVQLVHKSERRDSQQEIMRRVRESIAALDLPLRDLAVDEIGIISGPGWRNAELMYSLRGPNMDRLQLHSGRLMERMRRAGGYVDLNQSYETGRPEVSLEITRERAADLGVSAVQIGRTISALFAGYEATSFEEEGERYDVRVQVRPEYRDDLSKLDLVHVRGPGGALVPLRNLVTPRIGSGPVQIDRADRTRAITVYGNLEGKSAGEAGVEVMAFGEELGVTGEYALLPVGPSERLRETLSAIVFAFVLALIAIYMILAAQFNSFVHPFTIMLSAPLSFIGAFAFVALLGQSLDVMGQIAFLMLMGIVMKNGILLVDYTNTLRARGLPLMEAVLEAGPIRMRPVLMTAVSTIFGMIPVAFGTGDGSEWRNPMGVVAIGGLATSTLLTLLVVPVVYTLIDDAGRLLTRGLGRVRRAEAAPGVAAVDTLPRDSSPERRPARARAVGAAPPKSQRRG